MDGRLDYLNHRMVAVLVYRHWQHLIDVFIWPADSTAKDSATPRSLQGFQVLGKTSAEMTFRVVSEVHRADLQQLIDLL